MRTALLVGNPNCGKTTLFNALTGQHQRVGNWAGVTVEQKQGIMLGKSQDVTVVDLPGLYSLSCEREGCGEDELSAALAVHLNKAEIIVNVVDATHLERHLYLTSQLLELKKPIVLVLTMVDVAADLGIIINTETLSKELGCPVVPVRADKKPQLELLKQYLTCQPSQPLVSISYSQNLVESLSSIELELVNMNYDHNFAFYYSRRWLEGDTTMDLSLNFEGTEDADILMADTRYHFVHNLINKVQTKKTEVSEHITAKLDKVILHRFWSIPIFIAVIYTLFAFTMGFGGMLQAYFDTGSELLFVTKVAQFLEFINAPSWLVVLLANGLGRGINTTITLIPVLATMFFALAFLESSGYMARAAFVVDRVMRAIGLPGKAFVPMIVGFGCNVPAIAAARTLQTPNDRLLMILMSPFMSCSARLAIYTMFVAVFFPNHGTNIVFSLYLAGIAMAIVTGFALQNRCSSKHISPMIIELPTYHLPAISTLLSESFRRLQNFIKRAGKWIVPACVVLGGMGTLKVPGSFDASGSGVLSLLEWVGHTITPFFAPMGISAENWPAAVGLLSGTLAKEVVVGTLNALYTHPDSVVTASIEMSNRFGSAVAAYSYLLFILLYIPCVSTMAAIKQHASKQWMHISVAWSFLIAYSSAVLFYQWSNVYYHPFRAIYWSLLLSFFVMLFVIYVRKQTKQSGGLYAATAS